MEQQEKQMEIDLIGLLYFLKKRILVIIAIVLLFAIAGVSYGLLFVAPTYVAEAQIYVLNRSSVSGVMGSDFQISTYMLQDYKVLITGKNVTKEVIKQMDLDMTPAALSRMISVTAPEDTRVLQINVTDVDAQRAAAITNKVCEIATQQIQKITDADAVHLIYGADVPVSPAGPNLKNITLLSLALGLVASVAILTVRFALDDAIRTEEDVERYLGLSVLGIIPDSKDINTAIDERNPRKQQSDHRNAFKK